MQLHILYILLCYSNPIIMLRISHQVSIILRILFNHGLEESELKVMKKKKEKEEHNLPF